MTPMKSQVAARSRSPHFKEHAQTPLRLVTEVNAQNPTQDVTDVCTTVTPNSNATNTTSAFLTGPVSSLLTDVTPMAAISARTLRGRPRNTTAPSVHVTVAELAVEETCAVNIIPPAEQVTIVEPALSTAINHDSLIALAGATVSAEIVLPSVLPIENILRRTSRRSRA